MNTVTTIVSVVLLSPVLFCLASDDGSFQLYNKATDFCLVHRFYCRPNALRWTTGDRLLVPLENKCLGAQGTSVGSGISQYECDEKSDLQKWECKNETLLALKGHDLYIELINDGEAVLTKNTGPKTHLTIENTQSGPCTKKARVLYTIGGNAFGRPCMFPFLYKNIWYSDCTTDGSSTKHKWCSVETNFENELWGFCPTNDKELWKTHPITGARFQLNTQSALTWSEADSSCKQQSSSLLSITDPNEQAYITALLMAEGVGEEDKFWVGLTLNPEHGWHWSNGRPYRYLKWDSGHPLNAPGHSCAIIDAAVKYSWQSSPCNKKLGYICYSKGSGEAPVQPVEQGFCSSPWIPYNGHCFHLHRELKTWADSQKECRKEEGDLVSIRDVEDQSFVISQLGYASTDELWIGLNDRRTEGLFDWSDHSTVSFTSWEYGEPSVSSDTEDCVLMRGEDGNWADRACAEKHGFICMKPSASEASGDEVEQNIGCKTGWKRHGSYCYFVGTQTKTFEEAKEDCKSTDSYLADVSNGLDNAFLVSIVGMRPEKYFWIGLSNQKHIDTFVWTNTDSVKYSHWNTGMPGHLQGCVAMGSGIFAGIWDVLPCTNKEKYICKHLAEGAIATSAPKTVAPPTCPEGWLKKSKNFCYKFFPGHSSRERKTWFEARDYCRAIGGDLISLHNQWQIPPNSRTPAWIGLSAPDSTASYVWSDGSAVNFQHWENGEPNGKNNMESCVETKVDRYYGGGSWQDDHCEKKNGFVCQIQIGVTPKPPPDPVDPDFNTTADGWLERNGTQYYFNTRGMANEEARQFCRNRHGDLVTINSEAESIFLWNQISRDYWPYWLGLNVDFDGTFQWMDGSQVVFQKWNKGQPNFKYYDENCAAMSSTGFWHNHNCGHEFRSICKRSSTRPVNATVAPTTPLKGGCKPQWKQFKSKCYSIIKNQKLKWSDARQQCLSMNARLASIPSRHEEVFLLSQMVDSPTADLWIGLHHFHDKFLWSDRTPISYVNLFFPSWRMFFSYEMDNCVVISTNPSVGVGKWKQTDCNHTYGYICQQNVDPRLPESSEPTPTDFIKILNDSIKVVTKNLTWDAAKRQCDGEDAKLASLRNEWTQAYVELQAMNLQVPVWIGLNTDETSGYFRYIDGWHLSFSKWGNGEPKSGRPCVYVDVNGYWKTAHCNQTMHSVCMKSTDVPPTESSQFEGVCPNDLHSQYGSKNHVWLPFKGHCYKIFTTEKDWSEASVSCVEQSATLVSIEDPSEQEFILSKVEIYKDRFNLFWIGLFKTFKGEWQWLDKTVMDYSNWDEEQPGTYGFTGISTGNGKWKTKFKRWPQPYICKTPKVLPEILPSPTAESVHLPHRSHMALAAVLVITGIALGIVVAFFTLKKSSLRLPIPERFTTFDNPLFFSNDSSPPDVVDTKTLIDDSEHNGTTLVTI